jgi:hypothetical protein
MRSILAIGAHAGNIERTAGALPIEQLSHDLHPSLFDDARDIQRRWAQIRAGGERDSGTVSMPWPQTFS